MPAAGGCQKPGKAAAPKRRDGGEEPEAEKSWESSAKKDVPDEFRLCEIRDGQGREIAELAYMERQIFSDAWTEKGIRETLRQNNTVALGIWKEGLFAGYVIMYYVLDEGEIARIAVDPSCRRQGAARRLFGRLVEICEKKGIGRLMLEVRQGNQAAVSFYQRCGFTVDGLRKGYYTNPSEDAILMSRMLCPQINP